MDTLDTPKNITIPLGEAQLTVPVSMLVRTFLKQYAADSAPQTRLAELQGKRIRIGARGLYGTYAGIARGVDGADDYIVEVLDDSADNITWPDAMKWAESIGGVLPTRKESALLFANVPELFKREYYWTCEPSESGSSYAWSQNFNYGNQNTSYQSAQLRARAVRRLELIK